MYFDFYLAGVFFLILASSSLIVGILLLKYNHRNNLKKALFLSELTRQKTIFPLKIKAVERFALFLERLRTGNLLTRIKPVSEKVELYKLLLTATIEQEFNHNAVQKLYISNGCYQNIEKITQETIKYIRNTDPSSTDTFTLIEFNEVLLSKNTFLNNLIDSALLNLKNELKSYT
jgi:hypothetical protein